MSVWVDVCSSGTHSAGPLSEERILEAWSILRDAGYAETSRLPYFRSLSRLPAEPRSLIRFLRHGPGHPRSAFPRTYYRLFQREDPGLFDLFSLLSLGWRLRRDRFEQVLEPGPRRLFESAGLIRVDGDHIQPLLRIYLFDRFVFFFDAPESRLSLEQRAYMGRDSLRFASYLTRGTSNRTFKRALDLGTGCGIQATVLADRCDEVVAVDNNGRALSFARLNARINGISNVTFLHCDFTAQANTTQANTTQANTAHASTTAIDTAQINTTQIDTAQSNTTQIRGRFDLVVSNPPFLYLPKPLPEGPDPASDGGLMGIGASRRILSRLDGLLEAHGEAAILVSVPRRPGRPILETWMRRILLPRGFDVRLRFVEYLWRDDQRDAYRARGLKTPALVVAEVRRVAEPPRGAKPRLRRTSPPLSERLILARKIVGKRLTTGRRQTAAVLGAVHPERLRRIAPLAVCSSLRTRRVPVSPLRLAIEPSTRCPLDCISCARAERIGNGRHMDAGLFERIVSKIHPRMLHFHGAGEPLAHPDIAGLCRLSREAGARTVMMTGLPEESMIPLAERCLPYLDRLVIGVDAIRPETYTTVRRGGEWDSVAGGIRHLVRCRSQQGLNTSLLFSFLILGQNYEEIPAFVRFAYRMGADAAIFWTVDLYGIESRAPVLIDSVRSERLMQLLEKARCVATRIGIPTNLDLMLESPMLLRYRYGGESLQGNTRCLRPWLSTYITVDGEVRPCSRYAYDTDVAMGHLSQTPEFAQIWNGSAYQQLRRELAQRCPTLRACRECPVPVEEGGLLGNLWRRRKSP